MEATTSTALDDVQQMSVSGLHRGGGVDVGDDDGAGVLGLPRPQLVGGDRVGQRAAGPLVRDQHGLVGAEDLRGLGHEVHAAEHDGVLGRLGGDPGQRQRVTDVVGDVLDGGKLVVVRQDRGVAQVGQPADLGRPLLVAFDTAVTVGRVGDSGGQMFAMSSCQPIRQHVGAIHDRHSRSFRLPARVFDL